MVFPHVSQNAVNLILNQAAIIAKGTREKREFKLKFSNQKESKTNDETVPIIYHGNSFLFLDVFLPK